MSNNLLVKLNNSGVHCPDILISHFSFISIHHPIQSKIQPILTPISSTSLQMSWCLRLETPSTLWVHCGCTLRRLRLPENLKVPQAKILSTSSPDSPVEIEVEWGPWRDGAFDGKLVRLHVPPPKDFIRKKRQIVPMQI